MGGDTDFKFGTSVDHNKSQTTDDTPPLKGAWSWLHNPFQISLEWLEAGFVKFCMQVGYAT